jgi:hypothetical protein
LPDIARRRAFFARTTTFTSAFTSRRRRAFFARTTTFTSRRRRAFFARTFARFSRFSRATTFFARSFTRSARVLSVDGLLRTAVADSIATFVMSVLVAFTQI